MFMLAWFQTVYLEYMNVYPRFEKYNKLQTTFFLVILVLIFRLSNIRQIYIIIYILGYEK